MQTRSYFILFFFFINLASFGQETPIYEFSWEPSIPSLTYVSKQEVKPEEYSLMEVNLAIDLRRQGLRKNISSVILPEDKFISSSYKVAFPQNNFRVYGTGYNGYTTSSGGIKNTAYKDASLYSGPFCPVTGIIR